MSNDHFLFINIEWCHQPAKGSTHLAHPRFSKVISTNHQREEMYARFLCKVNRVGLTNTILSSLLNKKLASYVTSNI